MHATRIGKQQMLKCIYIHTHTYLGKWPDREGCMYLHRNACKYLCMRAFMLSNVSVCRCMCVCLCTTAFAIKVDVEADTQKIESLRVALFA